MPQIQQNEKGGRIIWDKDDFINGLSPQWKSGSSSVIRGGNKLSYMIEINPFRKWGTLLPGYRGVAATNASAVTKYLRKGLVNIQYAYCIGNNELIHRYDPVTNTILNSGGVFPHTVAAHGGHTTVVLNDCVIYNAKVGGTSALRYFYSWSDNTDWDIGVYDFTSTFDDDFMSTAPGTPLAAPYITGGVGAPHPLIVGDDDLLYIGDRNFLHAYDGQNAADNDGKFFPAVLTLPAQWIITSIQKTNDGLMIFSYYNNQTFGGSSDYRGAARAWEYKYGELDITRSYDLNDNLTSESFVLGSTLGVFTYGRQTDPNNTSKNSKIQLFDGIKFTPEVSFTDNLPIRGGVEVSDKCITWNSQGIIYTYGSKILGLDTGLNRIGQAQNTGTSGMLATFWDRGGALAVSAADTGIEAMYLKYTENGFYTTPLAEPVFPLYSKGRLKNITIEWSNKITDVLETTDIYLTIFDENGTEQLILDTFTDVTSASKMVIQRQETTASAPLMAFDSIGFKCRFQKTTSGIATESFGIKRMIMEYEIINTNN